MAGLNPRCFLGTGFTGLRTRDWEKTLVLVVSKVGFFCQFRLYEISRFAQF